MKPIKMIIVALLAVAFTTTISAQGTASKTESIKVSGNCEMCKSTIEKAAKVEGVAKADWSTKTKILTLVYNPAKVKSDNVQKKIAAAGYDTPKYKATAATYASLPGCCKYR